MAGSNGKIEGTCCGASGLYLHFYCEGFYIDKQNQLTELRLMIPTLAKEAKESPIHLMELARKPEFSHLRWPYLNEVITLQQGSFCDP
jgi:hypothetical protein